MSSKKVTKAKKGSSKKTLGNKALLKDHDHNTMTEVPEQYMYILTSVYHGCTSRQAGPLPMEVEGVFSSMENAKTFLADRATDGREDHMGWEIYKILLEDNTYSVPYMYFMPDGVTEASYDFKPLDPAKDENNKLCKLEDTIETLVHEIRQLKENKYSPTSLYSNPTPSSHSDE